LSVLVPVLTILISAGDAIFPWSLGTSIVVETVATLRSLEEIRAQLQELKPMLKKRFKVETIDIFGSYARGDQTEKSDIDVLVTYSEGADLLLVAGLRRYLRRKLHVKVDVVSKKFLNPTIKDQVLKESIPI
jgi:uncharacterized protein